MIKAEIVADSKNEFGNRITTMVVTFPRIILAELNTHRMFSRNSASSRAIPFKKMLESVTSNPFIPIAWQKDHKGMQGASYLEGNDLELAKDDWNQAKEAAILHSDWLSHRGGEGVTKQLCNRLLEPFMWHTCIITATEWENFFALRCPAYKVVDGLNYFGLGRINDGATYYRSWKDLVVNENQGEVTMKVMNSFSTLERLKRNHGAAEIHMMTLAEVMWDAYNESIPKELKAGEWHIPFGDNIDNQKILDTMIKLNQVIDNRTLEDPGGDIDQAMIDTIHNGLIKIATARCARVSYIVVGEEDKKDNYENDIKLYDRLLESRHMSPFEHCAKAISKNISSGNFTGGWLQYRKLILEENIV